VQWFESPHTGTRVAEFVICTKWFIPSSKVFWVLTDDGSNMVAAFKKQVYMESYEPECSDNEQN
jgi:hypothetical protein